MVSSILSSRGDAGHGFSSRAWPLSSRRSNRFLWKDMTNTPLTGEIWHLSIDDLLAPLPETARLGGPGPFLINLSASTAPIPLPVNGTAASQHAQVSQVHPPDDRPPPSPPLPGPHSNGSDR